MEVEASLRAGAEEGRKDKMGVEAEEKLDMELKEGTELCSLGRKQTGKEVGVWENVK